MIPSNTSIVFADLADALADLEAARGSPKEVRRAFSRFVDVSQRLTSAMRKDFSRERGSQWDAASFPGWDKVTEFFKWLRNQDQHEPPIRISVHERRFYAIPGQPGRLFPFEGTWNLADQLADTHPSDITFYPIDRATGEQMPPEDPVRIEYQYLIQPHSNAARSRLRDIGTTDVHQLSSRCFAVLNDYHEFFLRQLGT
jgi:hypothetical protein